VNPPLLKEKKGGREGCGMSPYSGREKEEKRARFPHEILRTKNRKKRERDGKMGKKGEGGQNGYRVTSRKRGGRKGKNYND